MLVPIANDDNKHHQSMSPANVADKSVDLQLDWGWTCG